MAEAIANIIPINSTTCKVVFIGNNAPRTDEITTIVYNSVSYDVNRDESERSRWCIVTASFDNLGGTSRGVQEYESVIPPIQSPRIVLFSGDSIKTFNGDNIILFE